MPEFRWPAADEHTVVVGKTGSGKTWLGAYLLGTRNLKSERWIAYDSKGDALLNSLENARHIDYSDGVPAHPGLYIVHTVPGDEKIDARGGGLWENHLWRIYNAENTGVYIDEGYMAPQNNAYRALLTQGRAKRIPVTTLTQRPVDLHRAVFSEAGHVALFNMNDDRDLKTISEFTSRDFVEWLPPEMEGAGKLPKYHARWYNKNDDTQFVLRPVPDAETIRARIDDQLEPRRRFI